MARFLLLFMLSFLGFGQEATYVPDDNFEQALIELGYDDILNDFVLTSSIDTITFLNLSNKNIDSVIGIEDFVSLEILLCSGNLLLELNLSNNTSLQRLRCGGNLLSELDLSNNTSLRILRCGNNFINSLDLSNNSSLQQLFCRNNLLDALNLKNSNNTILDSLFTTNNSDLNCIEANNLNYLNTNFSFLNGSLDEQHYFSSDCDISSIFSHDDKSVKYLLQKFNVLGKETHGPGLQLELYSDGSVEKQYIVK